MISVSKPILPHILHVDDSEDFLDVFKMMFKNQFIITSVSKADEALKSIEERDFDLVTLDFEMPGMNGLELLKHIKQMRPDLPVVFYTGQGNEEIARKAFLAGASDYFSKDINAFAHREKIINSFKKAIEARHTRIEKNISDKIYRTLFEKANDAIFLLKDMRFIDCNQKALNMFGLNEEMITGYFPCHFSPEVQPNGEDSEKKFADFAKKAISGTPQMFEWVYKKGKDTLFYTEVSLNRMELEGEEYILSIVRDINERKELEKERISHISYLENIESIGKIIRSSSDVEDMLRDVLDKTIHIFNCDRAWLIYPCDPDTPEWQVPMERTKPEYPGANKAGEIFSISDETAEVFRRGLEIKDPVCYDPHTQLIPPDSARKYGVKSQMLTAIYPRIDKPWLLGIHQCTHARIWSDDEKALFKEIGNRITDALNNLLLLRNLKESETRYRLLIENMNDGIVIVDADNRFTYLNPQMCKMLGFNCSEMVGRDVREFLNAKDREILEKQLIERKKGSQTIYEMEWKRKDGGKVITLISPRPVFDDSKNYIGSFAVITDITDHKQTERILEESLETIRHERKMFMGGPVVVFKWKNEKNWPAEYVSENSRDILGYSVEEFTSGSVLYNDIIHAEDIDRVASEVERFSDKGVENFSHEPYRVKRKDGKIIWVADYTSILKNVAGEITHYLGFLIDISRRQEAEKELLAKNRELNDFTHIVSHDLKGEINLILNYLELIKNNPEEMEEYYERPMAIGTRLLDFIDNLLSLSRAGKVIGEKVDVNVEEEIKQVFDIYAKPESSARLSFVTPVPCIRTDPICLRQLFSNLIQNSINYRDTKKEMLIIEVSFVKDEDNIRIIYKDNGAGIPEKYLNDIFRPGFRLKKGKGTGFGLSIVKKIVDAHNGKIHVKSGIGKGTEFSMELPSSCD